MYEEVFFSDEFSQIKLLYEQLYPDKDFSQEALPVTYHKFGCMMLANDLIGSEMPGPNSKMSAVVMAYWPSRRQHLDNIDYSTMKVGVVQYFVRHKICLKDNTSK